MNRLFRPTCHVLLLASLALCSLPALALPEAFSAALREAGIPPGRVAVVIQPVDAPAPLLAHNAEHALNPASVMKLVTSFAALEQLGPAYTWTTELWANGPISNGRLQGNLVIKGKGDPSLTLERLWLMQRELRSRGIRDISGDLVLDTSHFNLPPHDPAAFDNEPLALYNAAPGALVANFNATTLRLVPDRFAGCRRPGIRAPRRRPDLATGTGRGRLQQLARRADTADRLQRALHAGFRRALPAVVRGKNPGAERARRRGELRPYLPRAVGRVRRQRGRLHRVRYGSVGHACRWSAFPRCRWPMRCAASTSIPTT
jgi:D-alanyl-D-alanine carboxypeptidase